MWSSGSIMSLQDIQNAERGHWYSVNEMCIRQKAQKNGKNGNSALENFMVSFSRQFSSSDRVLISSRRLCT